MDFEAYEITAIQRILAWQVSQALGFENEETAKEHALLLLVDYDADMAYPQMIGKYFDTPHFSATEPAPWSEMIERILALRVAGDGKDKIRAFWSPDAVRAKFARGQCFDALDYQSIVGGARKWTRAVQYLLEDPDNGHLMCYCWVIEIDSFRRNQTRTTFLAEHDPLTGLYNRHKLNSCTLGTGAYVLVDVNDFKHINDTYGHHAGDKALIALADKIEDVFCCSCESLVFRLGGDEFLVFMKGASEEAAVACLEQLAEPLSVEGDAGERFELSVAAGYVMGDDP
ncbi:MAG: GGDEF domain-containing protein, partial [Coriobacteriales bacterium]|nr:GGDEF domain-containing protein [Coriobacteriales bacterium]